jgi:hypothetical protein
LKFTPYKSNEICVNLPFKSYIKVQPTLDLTQPVVVTSGLISVPF